MCGASHSLRAAGSRFERNERLDVGPRAASGHEWEGHDLASAGSQQHSDGGRAALSAPPAGVSPVSWARCVGSPSMHSRSEAPQEQWQDPTVCCVVRGEP
eukprot:12698795-Alexandrium_andersonii.AAC.1